MRVLSGIGNVLLTIIKWILKVVLLVLKDSRMVVIGVEQIR